MKVNIKEQPRFVMELSREEAAWLKELLKNWLGEGEEPEDDAAMRDAFWSAIDRIGIN